ncbi:MAG: cytochrome b N-terminal domain-containing protein [Deltaproteobacteria bacterium]|nr:cytochrome b N-terminal domain-containing protein [Deltaproteobacteria bacterium]
MTMRTLLKRIRDSVFRVGWPRDERSAVRAMISSVTLHIHAPKVRPSTLRFRATWTLGLVSFLLLGILTITGIYLMFYYSPHPVAAFRSMKDLAFVVPFGTITRNMHRWGAHAMVIVVTTHMLRVFLSGGYKPPREANWVVGVMLWVLTLGLSFTGYLLPWDQLAFWAVTVGANMVGTIPGIGDSLRTLLLGDHSVGESALLRFYVLHCVVLPSLVGGLVAFHIFRVRKDGGLVTSEHEHEAAKESAGKGKGDGPKLVPSWPHLVYRELTVTLVVIVGLLVASLWFHAPLEPEADPTRTPNPAKAPWYFLGVQELAHYSAFWGGVFIPAAIVFGLCAVPYFDRDVKGSGRYFPRERWLANSLFIALLVFLTVVTVVGTYFRGPGWAFMYWPY